jgi:pimeloyl-ACP methyl ester carboxylesterase
MAQVPLLMLPGLLLDERLYAPQIVALADLAEPRVADLTGADSIAGMAEQVLGTAPERFALCGLSMGGYVALEIMRRAPERVLKLALLDTQARPDPDERRAGRREQIAKAEGGHLDEVVGQLLQLFIHPQRQTDGVLTDAVRAMAAPVGVAGFRRQQTAIMNRPDSRPALAAIRCATLVLCGRQDVPTPVELHEELAAAVPDATLVVLPHCGHLSPLEQPAAVSAQLRVWLSG